MDYYTNAFSENVGLNKTKISLFDKKKLHVIMTSEPSFPFLKANYVNLFNHKPMNYNLILHFYWRNYKNILNTAFQSNEGGKDEGLSMEEVVDERVDTSFTPGNPWVPSLHDFAMIRSQPQPPQQLEDIQTNETCTKFLSWHFENEDWISCLSHFNFLSFGLGGGNQSVAFTTVHHTTCPSQG